MPLQLYERRVAMGRLRFALSVIDNISEWECIGLLKTYFHVIISGLAVG